jgi:hypothetical protein
MLIGTVLPFPLLLGACGDEDTVSGSEQGSAPAPTGGRRSTGGHAGDGDPVTGGRGSAGASSSGGDRSRGGDAGASGDSGAADNAGAGGDTGVGGDRGAVGSAGAPESPNPGPAPVLLGSAENYVLLAMAGISNVPTSAVTGNLGLSPAAASYITGFALTRVGTYWTAPEVTGQIFAADNDPPSPDNLTTAVADMMTAYADAEGRVTPDFLDLVGGDIGGLTLSPGLYRWVSTVTIPSNITLRGASDSTWIFQVTGDLDLSVDTAVLLQGGAQPANIVWQVAGEATLGADSHFEGVILSKTAIALGSGASLNGRLLAQTAITLSAVTITEP